MHGVWFVDLCQETKQYRKLVPSSLLLQDAQCVVLSFTIEYHGDSQFPHNTTIGQSMFIIALKKAPWLLLYISAILGCSIMFYRLETMMGFFESLQLWCKDSWPLREKSCIYAVQGTKSDAAFEQLL